MATLPPVQINGDPHEDKGPLVAGLLAFTLGLGGIFVFARVLCRTVIRPQFGWDDGLIVVAWLTAAGFNVAIWVSISQGYGKHITALTPEQAMASVRSEVVGEVLAVFAYPPGKASVAYLLQRLFPGRKLRWLMWTFVALNTLFFYLNGILLLVQCQPVAFQWDRLIPSGTCWDPKVLEDWGYLTGVTGCVTDFIFAIVPWFYISRLKITRKEKFFIGIALSTGFFAGVCSILKIYQTSTLAATADVAFNTYPLVLWGATELAAINIAACIPTLRPLILWMGGKNPRDNATFSVASYSHGAYGYGGSQSLRSNQRDVNRTDPYNGRIYQLQSYDVTVKDRENWPSDPSRGSQEMGAHATARHAF